MAGISKETKIKLEKTLLLAMKVAVGSAAAVYIAEALHLEYAVSAGTVALLTLMGSKKESLRVSVIRLVTFFFTVLLLYLFIPLIHSDWITYCVVLLILVTVSAFLGWIPALSINFVIIAHYITKQDFSLSFLWNEFQLVFIGVFVALILNLFQLNKNRRKDIVEDMRYTEERLQYIMRELAEYLLGKQLEPLSISVWEEICTMEKKLREFMEEAREYRSNNFAPHHDYYVDYFEMRLNQCHMLDSLHAEMKNMRTMPKQAKVIADYMNYLSDYVIEKNVPSEQIKRLQKIFADMKKEEMPKSRDEFESRALLYHVLLDIEEFLKFKMNFIENLSEKQRQEYWK